MQQHSGEAGWQDQGDRGWAYFRVLCSVQRSAATGAGVLYFGLRPIGMRELMVCKGNMRPHMQQMWAGSLWIRGDIRYVQNGTPELRREHSSE